MRLVSCVLGSLFNTLALRAPPFWHAATSKQQLEEVLSPEDNSFHQIFQGCVKKDGEAEKGPCLRNQKVKMEAEKCGKQIRIGDKIKLEDKSHQFFCIKIQIEEKLMIRQKLSRRLK